MTDFQLIRSVKMRTSSALILCGILSFVTSSALGAPLKGEVQADDVVLSQVDGNERPLVGAIESLGVFKNGIAAVREEFHVSQNGRYFVTTPLTAIHGTFFVESDARVETKSSQSEVAVPANGERIDWTSDFKGRWIQLTLPGEKEARTVRVVESAPSGSVSDGAVSFVNEYAAGRGMQTGSVLLESENGELIWLADSSAVAAVVVKDGTALRSVMRQKNRLSFDVTSVGPDGATICLSYLTRQLAWAPQYRVELVDNKNLELEQSAVLINDWRDFSNAPTSLFSGFPQILMQNSLSPISPDVSLARFFSGLNGGANARNSAFTSQMVLNSASYDSLSDDASIPAIDEEFDGKTGVDVFAQKVGVRSLKKGERALFVVDKKTAPYRRFIRWDIVDARESSGQMRDSGSASVEYEANSYGATTTGKRERNPRFTEPWDVVLFRNPFDFPLTTGPASVYESNRFLGQNSLSWRNSGEETVLPITKALGVRVKSSENERVFSSADTGKNRTPIDQEANFSESDYFTPTIKPESWGRVIELRGAYYRFAVVDATIELNNQRNETTEIMINRQFSGVALPESFEGFEKDPETTCLSATQSSDYRRLFNPLWELDSRVVLKPFEKRTLRFSYQILIAL